MWIKLPFVSNFNSLVLTLSSYLNARIEANSSLRAAVKSECTQWIKSEF